MADQYQVGGWYNGKQWNGSSFGAAGQITVGSSAGQQTSSAVNAQSAAAQGKSTTDFSNYLATNMQAPVSVPHSSGATGSYVGSIQGDVDKYQQQLDATLAQQKAANDAKMAELRKTESDTLSKVGELTTPFRQNLETTQRESLHINQNFEANQNLVNELGTLLTQGNDLIKQQQSVTGLAAVRNPRIQQTMSDVAARAGVIQAVMSARNGQISQAETMIDRSITAISQDKQDQLSYYKTVLDLNSRDIVSLDADAKTLAQEKVNEAKGFLDNAMQTSSYFKQLLVNPATASLMGDAGVSVNDSPEQVSAKLSQASYTKQIADMSNQMAVAGNTPVYDPSGVPKSQLITLTDNKGVQHYFQKEVKPITTQQSASSFLQALTGAGKASSVQKPPSGPWKVGAIYTTDDGRVWTYTNDGWKPL